MADIRPFRIEIPQQDLDDLQERLARTRWSGELPPEPADEPAQTGAVPSGWEYGIPLAPLRELVAYWRDGYDWRAWERRLNGHPQFTTEIDGQNLHFVHVRSANPGATPLLMIHGWPNTVMQYVDLIDALGDAFHLVIPSLPGFAFSGPTTERGWNRHRVARALAELMARLGYDRYGVHGNDLGAKIAPDLGRIAAERVIGVHVTQVFSFPTGDPAEFENLTQEEAGQLRFQQTFDTGMIGFAVMQETAPQNVAHALADSPVGQLAWNYQLLAGLTRDQILTSATIYWLTNTAASAARLFYEDHHTEHPKEPTSVPLGFASFAYDFRPLRRFAERDHHAIVSWTEYDRGSHWAPQDAPDLLAGDIRQFFARFGEAAQGDGPGGR
ncbi:epoxide hydrolase family protein [Nonomuraea sp. NPDC049158]|uniref:epoxide hydrolase family protein n=1 Tax=Nonomuraea sp. NPDC049158 TaxID=3155649 RepID=UPI0033E7868A